MNEILANVALFTATEFCTRNGIDCSGSHIVKEGRGFRYGLVADDWRIVTVEFTKNSTPRFTVWAGQSRRRAGQIWECDGCWTNLADVTACDHCGKARQS